MDEIHSRDHDLFKSNFAVFGDNKEQSFLAHVALKSNQYVVGFIKMKCLYKKISLDQRTWFFIFHRKTIIINDKK